MMTPQQLKNSILQRAIEGKLVEQRPEEGTAKELLKAIKDEKAKLVKEGKIKKSKPLPPISGDEIPFDVPESWEWVRLGDVLTKITDGTHHSPPNTEKGAYKYITAKNIREDGINETNISYVTAEIHQEIFARCNPEFGDILLIKDGATTGIATCNDLTEPFSMLSSVALLKPSTYIAAWYIVYVIRSDLFYSILRKQMKGTGITRITLKQIAPLLIPLPPLSEQKRIVAKIEELLPLVDQYDKAYSQLTALNEKFPQDMKKSILQYAIEGKLVEQRPEEGTAKELLKAIKDEKAKLVKEGKIKKSKPLPPITEDEIPFDVPESWEWVRLGNIGKSIDNAFADGPFGSNLKSEHYTLVPEVRIIQLSNIGENGWRNDNIRYTTFTHAETIKRSMVEAGNIVIAKMMPAGRAIEVPVLEKGYILSSDAVKYVPHEHLCRKYLLYAINSSVFRGQIYQEVQGITRVRTSLTKLKKYLIPLPPLSEQKRIVAKIEELLPLCDKLAVLN